MKKLAVLLFVAAFSTTGAFADTLFAPDFLGVANDGAPAGYTSTTSGGGSITYSGDTMTAGDFSQPAPLAYIQGSSVNPMTETFTSQFTFTPNFTYTPNGGGQGNITLFTISTADANAPLFSVTLQPFRYSGTDNINFGSGIGYSTAPDVGGNASYSSSGVGSTSGQTFTVNDVTTSTDQGPSATPGNGDHWEVENKGTLSENGIVVYNFDFFANGDTLNPGSYDPAANPLTLDLGIINASSDGPTAPATNNYFAPDATVAFSDVSVIAGTVPEPSTCALFLGGFGALALIARRRATL